jgi:hypothetical protein
MKPRKIRLSKPKPRPPDGNLKSAGNKVGIVGTFDVGNFGDLLFPIIAELELTKRLIGLELHRYSYRRMDETKWPYPVESLDTLPSAVQNLNLMLVGGGHLIRFDKMVAPGYTPSRADLHHPTGYWLMPTLLGLSIGLPVAWNCVGVSPGTPRWAKKLLAVALDTTPYISVRDEASARELQDVSQSAQIHIVPDTAFGVHALISEQPSQRFKSWCQEVGLERPYVVVQASPQLGNSLNHVTAAVAAARARGCRVLELPISPVLGDVSRAIELSPPVVRLDNWPDPLLIAETIANAEAVLAQSLHLTIVALSCGIPVHRPAYGDSTKYGHIESMEGVHLWNVGSDAAEQMKAGLGKRAPGMRVREILAQLSGHWDRVAGLVCSTPTPRPEITASVISLCTQLAENGSDAVSNHEAPQNGSHRGSGDETRGREDTDASHRVSRLSQDLEQIQSQLDSLSSKTAELCHQAAQQANEVRSIAGKTTQLDRFEQRLQEVASEARTLLTRQEAYFGLIARVRNLVKESLPAHSTVLVLSNGDDQFISFGNHTGWHFPQTDSGLYAGRHPTDSAEAIRDLEKMRFKGAQYLLVPEPSYWWFESYPELSNYLRDRYRLVIQREETCKVFSLRERS